MIKISKEDKEYLEKYNIVIPVDSIEDLPDALDIIDDAIVCNIVDHNDEPDAHGIRLQRIYDRIWADNRDEYER